jgi:hypothetical protein
MKNRFLNALLSDLTENDSRGKGAQRTDNVVAWTLLGSYRFNQQMIGVSLAPKSAFSPLNGHW